MNGVTEQQLERSRGTGIIERRPRAQLGAQSTQGSAAPSDPGYERAVVAA
jgi:hypothetical protein